VVDDADADADEQGLWCLRGAVGATFIVEP
jgi:hypothetical protein